MQTIAQGKEAVLDFLEDHALAATNEQPGVYRLFRDDAGNLHERSAVCPHLGCIVSWNATERSWDCPCHGSRFDPYGKVLNGPAIGPLKTTKVVPQ